MKRRPPNSPFNRNAGQCLAIRAPLVFQGAKWSYNLFLFSTPYIVYSVILSGLYMFALKAHRKITAQRAAVILLARLDDAKRA